MHKIACLIPTRGDRPQFLDNCLKQIERQTLKPDFIEIVNDPPLSDKPDVTYRYRIGVERCKNRGADFILFTEDDDWISNDYIKTMYDFWVRNNKPNVIGISETIYYHVYSQKYREIKHLGRASMMSMAISGKLDVKWPDDNYSYTDLAICKAHGCVNLNLKTPISVGIKHGTGLCGGGGHPPDWVGYEKQDEGYKYLSQKVDNEALKFYISLVKDHYSYHQYSFFQYPFLSIVTRHLTNKRNDLFNKHQGSIIALKSLDFQQVFIYDDNGYGMLAANTSFQWVKDLIKGEWVFLLDDDDFITDPNFIDVLKDNSKDIDVIFFKNKILTGDGDELYPKPQSWETREPKRGQIGGSCFVVKKWVYDKYIHHFAHPSFGDWHFITEVLKDENVKCKWVDKLMFETGKVSHGKS